MRSTNLPHQIGRLRALSRYFRDSNASFFGKAFVVLAIAYVIFPFDAIPDVVPVVGWLDDIGVIGLAMLHLSRVMDKYRYAPLVAEVVPAPAPALRPEKTASSKVWVPARA